VTGCVTHWIHAIADTLWLFIDPKRHRNNTSFNWTNLIPPSAAAALTIAEPVSNGIGSDNFAILWDGRQFLGLNSSGVAPETWTPDYFRKRNGDNARTRGRMGCALLTFWLAAICAKASEISPLVESCSLADAGNRPSTQGKNTSGRPMSTSS
jgi:hypothetical protein